MFPIETKLFAKNERVAKMHECFCFSGKSIKLFHLNWTNA